MPSIYGKPQNVSAWLTNVENFYKPRTETHSPVSSMGQLLLTLPSSLQLTIMLKLNTEDLSAIRLVSRSFNQLARRYAEAVELHDQRMNKVREDSEMSSFCQPYTLTVEHLGSLSRERDVRKQLGRTGHPILLSRDIVD